MKFYSFWAYCTSKRKRKRGGKKQNATSNVAVLFKASSSVRGSIAKLSTVSAKAVFTYVRSVLSYGWIYPRPYGNRKLHDPLGWTKETEGARVKVGDAVTPQLPTYVSLHVAHNSPTTPRCLWLSTVWVRACVRTNSYALVDANTRATSIRLHARVSQRATATSLGLLSPLPLKQVEEYAWQNPWLYNTIYEHRMYRYVRIISAYLSRNVNSVWE